MLRWLFPTVDDKVAKARADLTKGRFAAARDTLDGLEHPDVPALRVQALSGLCQLNLEAARGWADAGETERVEHHLDLARSFLQPGLEGALQATRLHCVDVLNGQRQAAAEAARRAEARMFDVDPRFKAAHALDALTLPEGIAPDEAEAMHARLALLYENYPEALRAGMIRLGATFSSAVLDLDDGRVDAAAEVLATLPQDEPLVAWERARVAQAQRDPAAAAAHLRTFAERAGGHHEMGATHSAAALAQAEAEAGDPTLALETLRAARAQTPDLAAPLWAALLEVTGDLAGAEAALRGLIQKTKPQAWMYTSIARLRLKGGLRAEAVAALETGLRSCGCAPGSCGDKGPDLETHRMLATLYLEDQTALPRAFELSETARSLVQRPTWDDVYLAALTAWRRADADAPTLIEGLRAATPEGDPRRARLDRWLPAA
jgi:hypothetical protein